MWKWLKDHGWVGLVITVILIIIAYAYTRGQEVKTMSTLESRLEKMEPKVDTLETGMGKLENVLNREIIPNITAINEKLGPLPRKIEQVSALEEELALIQELVASRLMQGPFDVFFDFNSRALNKKARSHLALNAAWLRGNPEVNITLEGHTDERGNKEDNLRLGAIWADLVKDYLVSAGIKSGRIQTISYGEEKPFVLGHDESAWRLNRRVHFVLKR